MKILRRASLLVTSMVLALTAAGVAAQGDVNLDGEDERIAYAIGSNIGQNLQAQGLLQGLDVNVFVAGMLDAIAGTPQMSQEEMIAAIQLFQERATEQAEAQLASNLATSEEFLQENSTRDGVVTLDSGLQYLVLESGPADGASPTAADSVLAHYHGTLTDGSVFDSSVDRGEPAQFGLSQVIAGWTEALQLMKVGDKWRLFIPPGMAYGEASPTPAIPPNSTLIFDVELLEIR